MHHLIFIPHDHLAGTTKAEQLTAVGLASHAKAADSLPCPNGPAGLNGTLFGWLKPGGSLRFDGEGQTWIPTAADGDRPEGRYWVGVINASPPTPKDLEKPGQDAWGEPITLAGHEWLLPPVDLIPKSIAQFPDGSSGVRVKPEFAELVAVRESWSARLAGPPQMVSLVAMARFVVDCLAINYRIDLTLALQLGLFDEENIKAAMMLALRPRAFYVNRQEA